MIGLATVLVLELMIIASSLTALNIVKAFEESEEETIHLQSIQTPEQKADDEILKEQWLSDFKRLLNESDMGIN